MFKDTIKEIITTIIQECPFIENLEYKNNINNVSKIEKHIMLATIIFNENNYFKNKNISNFSIDIYLNYYELKIFYKNPLPLTEDLYQKINFDSKKDLIEKVKTLIK